MLLFVGAGRRALRGLLGGAAALLLSAAGAHAQTSAPAPARAYPEHRSGFRCAFDSAQDAAFARQPGARAAYQQFLRQAAQLAAQQPQRSPQGAAPDVTVPVVVHVIYANAAQNISDAQVQDALRVVNQDYSKTNPDTSAVIPFFQPRYANVGFRFRLARKDPNGNCTTGITRTFSALSNVGDDQVKSLIVWDQSRYLNIWVCQAANGAGGYAYLPCSGGGADGIVIRNAQFGSVGNSCGTNFCARSLTHEIGHYFGLPHTWGGSNTPGLPSNCGLDDGIADTPNTIGSSSCNLAFSPCTDPQTGQPILANVQNYMDYSPCTCMFTLGQRAVMRASLALGCRSALTAPANLVATGTNDGYQAPAGGCAPVVVFRASAPQVCAGGSLAFTDYSYNADLAAAGTQYQWTFPGGTPASSTQRNPTVTYSTSGIYDVTLTVTPAGGGPAGSRTEQRLVQVLGPGSGLSAPVVESFENPNFPNNFAAPDLRNWTSASTSTAALARWQRRAGSGLLAADGTACVVLLNPSIAAGTVTTLTSPTLNLSALQGQNVQLSFSRAYALRPTVPNEQLQVQFSTDCGVTWDVQATYPATRLNTLGAQRFSGFVPDSAQHWQPLTVPVDPQYVGSRLQIRFAYTSRGGNQFYLDAVRVGTPLAAAGPAAAAAGARLWLAPNPRAAETQARLSLPQAAAVRLRVLDALGRELGGATAAPAPARPLPAGEHVLPLPGLGQLAAGVYVVQAVGPDGRPLATARLLVP